MTDSETEARKARLAESAAREREAVARRATRSGDPTPEGLSVAACAAGVAERHASEARSAAFAACLAAEAEGAGIDHAGAAAGAAVRASEAAAEAWARRAEAAQ